MGTTLKKLQDRITKLKEESKKTGVDNKDKIKEVQRQIKKKKAYDKEYMRKYYLKKIKPDRQVRPKVEHTLTCTVCGTEFKAKKLGVKYCPECRAKVAYEKKKIYVENHKEEIRIKQKAYRQTEAYQQSQKKYRESERGKKHLHDYYQKPEVKERMREYQKTEKAKEYRKQYNIKQRTLIKQARAVLELAKQVGIKVDEI